MLEEIRLALISSAKCLGDYQNISKQDLANGYCDADEAGDDVSRDHYYSALVLRYWFKIKKYYEESKSAFNIFDCYEWLNHALLYALNHKPWRDPNNKLYGDPNGADKTINRCIISTRLINYQHANTDRSKINHVATSLDNLLDDTGDFIFRDSAMESNDENVAENLIKDFIHNNKVLEAMIIDGICNQDSFKEKQIKKVIKGHSYIDYDEDNNPATVEVPDAEVISKEYTFSDTKLAKHLMNIDENFVNTFSHNYSVDKELVENEVNKLKNMSPARVKTCINNVIKSFKSDEAIRELLSC